MAIEFGYHTWSYSSFGSWVPAYTLDETIKRLARIGFDGIEIGAAAPHAFPPYPWAWSRECLEQIADDAAQYGLTVVVEPLAEDSNLCESGEDALELMEGIARPNVKVMFDCSHVRYRRESLTDQVHLMGANLHQIHVAGTTATATRLPAGRGDEDWEGLVDALLDTGFDGCLTAETGVHRRGIDPDHDARTGLAFLKPLVARKIADRAALGNSTGR